MNYMRNDLLACARNVVNQTLGTLYYTYNFDDLELPNANTFKNGDVILHYNKVYVKMHDGWMKLDDNHNIIYTIPFFSVTFVPSETISLAFTRLACANNSTMYILNLIAP